MDLKALCLQTAALATSVADFIRTEASHFDKNRIEYKGLNDLVSYVDKEAERLVFEGLKQILPEAGLIGEEGVEGTWKQGDATPAGLYWIVDPVDGTTNFIHGLPIYATSIALVQDGIPIIGVVTDITRNDCYYAWQGGGAWRNGEPIHTSKPESLAVGLLATGFPYYDFDKMKAYLSIIEELMRKSHGLRRMGSAAIDLAYVACGHFEGFFEYNLKPWDVAGGALLVQEAGGTVTDFSGTPNSIFGGEIVAAGSAHEELRSLIHRHWQEKQ